MNALLLSAGLSERLRPLTDNMPKCLLPITSHGNMLRYWFDILAELGIDNIHVDVFYKKEQIISYLSKLPPGLVHKAIVYDETYLEPVGEVLYNLRHELGDEFLVINSDTYIEKSA